MFRFAMLVVASLLLTFEAYAWKDISIVDERTGKRCLNEKPFDQCVSKDFRYVRTAEGAVVVRLLSRRDTPDDEIVAIMQKFGLTLGKYGEWRINPGDKDYYGRGMMLQGLVSEDGKTELLRAEYTRVIPLSDKAALVRGVNRKWYIAKMGDGEPVLTPFEPDFDSWREVGGGQPERPLTIILRQDGPTKTDLRTWVVLDGQGGEAFQVSGVVPNPYGANDYYVFQAGFLGFPVRSGESEFSVIINTLTLELEKIGAPFEVMDVGYALTEDGTGNNTDDFRYYPLKKIGTLPSGKGLLSTDIYEPLSLSRAEPEPFKSDKARGMVPLRLPGVIGGVRGWLVEYGNDDERWYKLIAHAPKKDASHKDRLGRWDEIIPTAIKVYAWEPNEYQVLADIWIGTISEATHQELFAGANKLDIPNPSYRVAARFFKDPKLKSKGGLTDWILIGDQISARAIQQAYVTRDYRSSHPDNPQALATPSIIEQLKEEWKAKVEYREWIETPWEVLVARAEAEQAASLMASADFILSNGWEINFNDDFYYVARTQGGKYLQAYWNKYRQLPRSADAGDICQRFGNASFECGLVNPWASKIYQGQREAAAKEAQRYTQNQLNQQWEPKYRPPASEPRCYQTSEKTETCFYN